MLAWEFSKDNFMSAFLNVSTILFYVSLLLIIAMIYSKSLEIKSTKKTFLSKLSEKTDVYIINSINWIKRVISYINKNSAIALIQWIAYHILSWARELYVWLHKKAHAHPPSKKVIDMVRGRVEMKRNGGASFYLKSISNADEE